MNENIATTKIKLNIRVPISFHSALKFLSRSSIGFSVSSSSAECAKYFNYSKNSEILVLNTRTKIVNR